MSELSALRCLEVFSRSCLACQRLHLSQKVSSALNLIDTSHLSDNSPEKSVLQHKFRVVETQTCVVTQNRIIDEVYGMV